MTDSLRTSLSMAAISGGTVAAWTALPAYVHDPRARMAARGALMVASLLGVMVVDVDPAPQPERDEAMAALARALDDPSERTALWAAGLIGLVAASALSENVVETAATSLWRRGVPAPRTVLGLGLGALTAGARMAPAIR